MRPPDVVPLDGEAWEVTRTWPRGATAAVMELTDPDGRVRGARWDEGSGVGVHPGGVDRRLPELASELALGSRLVVHRAGRRAVLRRESDSGPLWVKVTRAGRAASAARSHRAIAGVVGDAAVAAPLLEAHDSLLVFGHVPGRTLLTQGSDSSVPDAELRRSWLGLGRAIARLHATRPSEGLGLGEHDAAREHATVQDWTDPVSAWGLLPELDSALVAALLAPLREGEPAASGLLHRDLHDKQVLPQRDGRPGLVDLDTAAWGEPALDVANVLAHLDLRVRQGLLGPSRARTAREAFLAGCDPVSDTLVRVPAYLAAARLRLACVYALRPRWRKVGHDILADVVREAAFSA